MNQLILTYSPDAAGNKGELKDAQEIRSNGFTSSGVAVDQTIADYSKVNSDGSVDESSLIEAKTVENSDISPQGYVGTSIVTTYSGAQVDVNGGIKVSGELNKQVVTTSSFDNRGNALNQDIEKYYFDSGTEIFYEHQAVKTSGYDFHNYASSSTVTSYKDESSDNIAETQDTIRNARPLRQRAYPDNKRI